MEILVHKYDDEPCDLGLEPFEDRICLHGLEVRLGWVEEEVA